MADKKVSELTELTSVSGDDLLLVINDPSGTPASRKISTSNFLSGVENRVANVEGKFVHIENISTTTPIINATTNANTPVVSVTSATGLQCTKGSSPSSNNSTTEGVAVGTIFFSNTHLYIATDATTIKRVALEVF